MYFQLHFVIVEANKKQLIDVDGPGFPRYFDAFTGILIQGFALILERRVHGRNLLALATKAIQRLDQITHGHIDRTGFDHFTVCIAGVGALAQLGDHPVALVGLQQKLGKLGGFAQANRQHAGGQRVKGTGVPRLGGGINALDLLQGIVGGNAGRLVQQQNAVYLTATKSTLTPHD